MGDNSAARKLRRLAPRGDPTLRGGKEPPGVIPRRHAGSAACENCRRRKLKCSRERPICAACAKNGKDCVYENIEGETRYQAQGRKLREQDVENHKYKAFYEFLQQRDKRDVDHLLHRVRSGETVDEVIRTMNAAEILLHTANASTAESSSGKASAAIRLPQSASLKGHSPSHHLTSRGLLPRTASGVEFELTARHQAMYQTLLPLDVSTLPFNPFDNYRRHNEFPSSAGLFAGRGLAAHSASTAAEATITESHSPIRLTGEDSFRPNDARLEKINIAYWSNVLVSDKSAAMLITSFLEAHNAVIGYFDPELFLEDLVTGTPRFCSSFLVNSVLYMATLACTATDHRAAVLCKLLLETCESCLSKAQEDDICTLAAINIFGFGTFSHGRDKLGHKALKAGREMARRLKLYNVLQSSQEAEAFRKMPIDYIRATSHVAWGTFNWLTLHVLFYYDEAILIPPVLPIPGSQIGGSNATEASSSAWPPHALSKHMGRSYTYLCQLFTIANEFALVYIMAGAAPVAERVPLMFAESKFQKLLAWSDAAGRLMVWDNNSQHHDLLLCMWFHGIVLDIFRPYLTVDRHQQLKSFSSPDATPYTIFSASLNQLQRLALVYISKYLSSYIPYVNTSLMHIANAILARKTEVADTRYYFMLCMRRWQHLYAGFPVFGDVAEAFLLMAARVGVLGKLEADAVKRELREQREHHRLMSEAQTASVIVDFELGLRSREEARARTIFQELSMENQSS